MLASLDALVQAVQANAEMQRRITRRARELHAARRRGTPWRQIVAAEDRPLIVEMLRHNQEQLSAAGSRFRREEALALRQEGLTLDQIAQLFGVTRPRIVALLRSAGAFDGNAGARS